MSPAERNLMREQERLRHERLQRDVDAALRDAGLRLDREKRELFQQRYLQERRKIERELRQETDAKRNQQLPALNDRLKREFQQGLSSSKATAAPSPSVTPKK